MKGFLSKHQTNAEGSVYYCRRVLTAFTQPLWIDFVRMILDKELRIDCRNFTPMDYVKA
ncbi:hypothetical protein PVAP13_8KG214000 [Panicum virgatum]|uniref:Uncharacterized protein n=1 Tax=Panicum virgatum TaxID=38727 RepID=A0A8T0PGT2_PANVG|nr:hypothetical protein PVAP13_8KG214000 [Panicum virgatum]